MKRLFLVFIIALIIFNNRANAQSSSTGIVFFKGTWTDLLAESKKQQKLIFLDFYTDWCPPCKRMDAEIFPNKTVGEVYNKLFINYKINAEKGNGIELAKKFGVRAYPTWLFVDELGNMVLRADDYMSAANFIDLGQRAALKRNDTGSLTQFEKRFLDGERELVFLREYIVKLTSMKVTNSAILNTYVKCLPANKVNQADEIMFLGKNIGFAKSDAVQIVLSNLNVLSTDQKQEITKPMFAMLRNEFAEARKDKRLDDEEKAINDIDLLLPSMNETQVSTVNNLKLLFYTERKDTERMKVVGSSIASKLMLIPDEIIDKKNQEFYNEIMAPFLSGKEDSTKIPGFAEEVKRIKKNYSADIASRLYMVSEAYFKTLQSDDHALYDSLRWAERAHALIPNEATLKLKENIKAKIGS
ncbi:thioredoxin family protein [Pedobacter rhodius]|uniref:Thioredoxin family protein n=1 Tax=Pedobacter rhodius TaxID=3004098 RepID=A0ABT4L041_9SPHI|nr:thioredoxin family protein [Pedobacter sp. SJ11]MCZ4224532.1 thioredoxin family protein [Pedobacter sp. SJ11]